MATAGEVCCDSLIMNHVEHGAQGRALYLRLEPSLLAAIREGQQGEARRLLNEILTGIYTADRHRLGVLKSRVLELVVMLGRAAMEGGADEEAVLGLNYASLTELGAIGDEEELSGWVRRMLERCLEALSQLEGPTAAGRLAGILAEMEGRVEEPLRLEEMARKAGLSASQFSRLLKERTGHSFGGLLAFYRVERAKRLLCEVDVTVGEVAAACGFFDQSHFAKAFRKQTGKSPGEWRKGVVGG